MLEAGLETCFRASRFRAQLFGRFDLQRNSRPDSFPAILTCVACRSGCIGTSFFTPRRPWKKRVRTSLIGCVIGAAVLDVAFQERDAANSHQEKRYEGGAENRPGAAAGGADNVEAPPDAEVPEVVGVPGVAPESAVHHLALIAGVGFEASELPVADAFEEESDGPESNAHSIEDVKPMVNLLGGDDLEGE